MNSPQIAILIPHYNNPSALKESILSICEEITIDIFIVDDGSKEKPNKASLISEYKQGNLYFLELENNQGIENALNVGLTEITKKKYKYIGRLDCGDICKKDKFKKQINYLENNKDVQLLGTWVNIVDESYNYLYTLKHPVLHNEIKKKMYLNSMFVHPTVVFRSSVVNAVGLYPTNYKAAEDYAFFFKILRHFRTENYPEVLLDYVIDSNSISTTKRKLQVKNRIRVILSNFYFGIYPFYGLIRNLMLYFISRDTSNRLKKILLKK